MGSACLPAGVAGWLAGWPAGMTSLQTKLQTSTHTTITVFKQRKPLSSNSENHFPHFPRSHVHHPREFHGWSNQPSGVMSSHNRVTEGVVVVGVVVRLFLLPT